MIGKVAPEMLKPVPVRAGALIVTGSVPVEVSVTACATALFKDTSPKLMLVLFKLRPRVAALS